MSESDQKKLPRGMSLEREFAQWMKKRLGYSETHLRIPVKGKVADRAYEVDIHAVKRSHLADVVFRISLPLLGLAIATWLLPEEMADVRFAVEAIAGRLDTSLIGSGVLLLGVVASAFAYIGRQRSITHAWVECKDLRDNVKRAQVQKLASSVDDVKALDGAKWKPDTVILVSGNDFDVDAINFAKQHEFTLYRRNQNGFEPVG